MVPLTGDVASNSNLIQKIFSIKKDLTHKCFKMLDNFPDSRKTMKYISREDITPKVCHPEAYNPKRCRVPRAK